jgi:Tol biopolymer transport system component
VPGAVNSEGSQVFASVAANGNIYFASSRKSGNYDVFLARLVDGQYREAEDLGPVLNQPAVNTFEATVSPDESYLLLGSFGREDSLGSSDIFVSFNDRGNWGKPINLGPAVNSAARDYSPRISADGKWLYFTSERGMPYEKREQPLMYQQFRAGMDGIRNGLGNIYRIPLGPLLKAAREKIKM